jgi:protein-S-isoprenylcysteine O-methyltransferase Ste14
MIGFNFREKIEGLKRAGRARKALILAGVAVAVGYSLSGMVTVAYQSNPAAWAYQWAVVVVLVGLAVAAAARFLGATRSPRMKDKRS